MTDRDTVKDVTHCCLPHFIIEACTELAQGLQLFLYCLSIFPTPGAIQTTKMTVNFRQISCSFL